MSPGPGDEPHGGPDRAFEHLLSLAPEVVMVTDLRGSVTWLADATSRRLGLTSGQLLFGDWTQVVDGVDVALASAAFEAARQQPGHGVKVELRLRAGAGAGRWYSVVVTDVSAITAAPGCLVVGTYVHDRHLREEELREQAFRDSLTGLANRAVVEDRARQALARSARSDEETALAFIDLDDFKKVNDELGHGAGDDVLRATATRLLEVVRPSDTVARLGGDEFVVLVEGVDEPETVGRRLLEAISTPVLIDGRSVGVTASIGVAAGARRSVSELLREADVALYRAKALGKNRCCVALRRDDI